MTVREIEVDKNHNHTIYSTELSPSNYFVHTGCLSWPYLNKY